MDEQNQNFLKNSLDKEHPRDPKHFWMWLVALILLAVSFSAWAVYKDKQEMQSGNVETEDTAIPSPRSGEGEGEVDGQALLVADQCVKDNSIPDAEFEIEFRNQVDNWIYFSVTPLNFETDPAALFLENKNGLWVCRGFGTAFPELEEEFPNELFLIDWQTYRNEKFGYQLSYPKSWVVDNSASNKDFNLRGGGLVMGGDTYWENYFWDPPQGQIGDPPADHRSLYLIVYKDEESDTISAFVSKHYNFTIVELLEDREFEGANGLVGHQYSWENLDHPVGHQSVATIFKTDNNFYVFRSRIDSKPIHSQILSTFKFIE